jgi:hypothetical protein
MIRGVRTVLKLMGVIFWTWCLKRCLAGDGIMGGGCIQLVNGVFERMHLGKGIARRGKAGQGEER